MEKIKEYRYELKFTEKEVNDIISDLNKLWETKELSENSKSFLTMMKDDPQ